MDHSAPRLEDLTSVGSRISWAAILGGGLVTLAIYFMLTTLGAATGLSLSDRMTDKQMLMTAIGWSIFTFYVALFVGGMMTSIFTAGENKVEAVFSGVIMWAFVVGMMMHAGAAGARTTFMNIGSTNANWEQSARAAGVSSETIDEWRRKTNAAADAPMTEEKKQDARKAAWWAFGGTWGSMIVAALGALVGAGPTFRVVTVRPNTVPIVR